MAQMVDWESYNSLFSNVSKGEEFDRLEKRAESEVRLVVGAYRWSIIDETAFYYEQLKECICKTINKLVNDDGSGIGTGVSSVSNDGYSESYVVQTETQARAELQRSIRAWLSGTGLVGAL